MDLPTLYKFILVSLGIVNAWFLFFANQLSNRLKQTDLQLASVTNKLVEHENKFITDVYLRASIREEVAPVKADTSNLMATVQDLVTELRIINAINELKKSNEK